MYNNIHDEDNMHEGKKITLEKDEILKIYLVLTIQTSKQ